MVDLPTGHFVGLYFQKLWVYLGIYIYKKKNIV